MQLTTKVTYKGSIVILELIGHLNTNTSAEAENSVNQFVDKKKDLQLIIDLKATDFVSSAGLRVFLSTFKKMKNKSCAFIICSPNDIVQEVLSISGFTTFLTVLPTREEALKALQKD